MEASVKITASSLTAAIDLSMVLLRGSQSYKLEPLPLDKYEFTVKSSAVGMVQAYVKRKRSWHLSEKLIYSKKK